MKDKKDQKEKPICDVGNAPGGRGEMQSGVSGSTDRTIESNNLAHDDIQTEEKDALTTKPGGN